MKKITLELEDKIFNMLEEITSHYNSEDGLNCGIEETIEQIIVSHYYVEIQFPKESTDSNT